MKIWYFSVNPNISLKNTYFAPSIHIKETISGLQTLGHQVDVFSYGDEITHTEGKVRRGTKDLYRSGSLYAAVKPLIRDVYELYQNKFKDKYLVEPIFHNNSIDLIYERLFPSKSIVSTCAQKFKIPIIVESNAPVEERQSLWGSPLVSWINREERKTLKNADALTVVSTPLKRHYEKAGIVGEKIFVLPNGVNEERFSPEQVSRDIRSELGISDRLVVGFVGTTPYHGIDVPFLEIAKKLNLSRNNIHFLFVGAGSGFNKFKEMVKKEHLEEFFSLPGKVPNSAVPNYISAMDICLLPHYMWYGSPMKIFEYGIMGKAVVAPDMENIGEVLSHGETAYLFESGNFSEVAKAIHELANNEPLRTQLGKAIRAKILANHTWIKNAERIVEIYNRIVSKTM